MNQKPVSSNARNATILGENIRKMGEEIKKLFYQWSKELLEEERFKEMKDQDRWIHLIKTTSDWGVLHSEFIDATFKRWNAFERELLKTEKGKLKLAELLELKIDRLEELIKQKKGNN